MAKGETWYFQHIRRVATHPTFDVERVEHVEREANRLSAMDLNLLYKIK